MSRIGPRDTRTSMRADDWRDAAACRTEDPEIFFASELTAEGKAAVRHAKVICWRCPSMHACGQWAIAERVPFGVFGGVSESDRRTILRRRGIRLPSDDGTDEPKPRLTLQSVWDARTQPVRGGHLAFTGYVPVRIGGHHYTPQQIGFEVDRGRPPVGLVRRTCPVDGCVLPAHLRDQRERDAIRERMAESGVAS